MASPASEVTCQTTSQVVKGQLISSRRSSTKVDNLMAGDLGVSKNRGKTPKMDGENNGKPY